MSKADELWRRLRLADGIGSGVDPRKPTTRSPGAGKVGEKRYRELGDGTDASDSRQTGWAVLYGPEERARAEPHLADLLALRRAQAGENRFREMVVPAVDGTCVSGQSFLFKEIKEAPGVVDIERLPYYVLIVASPREVPWEFQFELAINRAVGRLYFEDPEDYARYAAAIKAVEAENEAAKKADHKRTLGFFFVERKQKSDGSEDKATPILADFLVKPVTQQLGASTSWDIPVIRGDDGRVRELRDIFEGRSPSGAGWVVLSHGAAAPFDSPGQVERQGAITCLDGRVYGEALDFPTVPFSGDSEGALLGKTFVLTACYGAGTTEVDEFKSPVEALRDGDVSEAKKIAPYPFVARLPQKLLGQGALGVFGHVGKGLTASYRWMYGVSRTEAARSFNDMLARILRGQRLGHAMRPMARRASNISAHFLPYLRSWMYDPKIRYHEIGRQWGAWTDARNFVLLGDPAAHSFLDKVGSQRSVVTGDLPTWRPSMEPAWEEGHWTTRRGSGSDDPGPILPLQWAVRPAAKASEWDFGIPLDPSVGSGRSAPALVPSDGSNADLVIDRTAAGRQFRNAEPPTPGFWQIKDHRDRAQSPPAALGDPRGRDALRSLAQSAARDYVAHRLSELKSDLGLAVSWQLLVDQRSRSVESHERWLRGEGIRLCCTNPSERRAWIKSGVWSWNKVNWFPGAVPIEPGGKMEGPDHQRPDFPAPFGLFPRPEQMRAHLVVIAATDPRLLDDLTDEESGSLISELEDTRLPSNRWLSLAHWSFHIQSVWYEL